MKKRIFLLAALAAGLVLCLAACGETNGDPITVTLWHVYGGEVNSPMNALVEEFNRTVGQEQGIRVRVDSVSNSGVIHESVLAAAYKDPGAPELPDLFVSYPKTVLALPDENILADYRDYFTDEELEGYLPEFVEEGTIHDRLVILPLTVSPPKPAQAWTNWPPGRGCTPWRSGMRTGRAASASSFTTTTSTISRWGWSRWARTFSTRTALPSALNSPTHGSLTPELR